MNAKFIQWPGTSRYRVIYPPELTSDERLIVALDDALAALRAENEQLELLHNAERTHREELEVRVEELEASQCPGYKLRIAAERRVEELEHQLKLVVAVLCETRGHNGGGPCRHCHDMFLAALEVKP